ncbi:hypothetical protein [uncultured Lactobacillus sp.]|uniref:hypothetical protein n=1 Tax=uncultured Lactobacillus sp. TaxID=153152 RepID=UPI00261B76DA|nr:hypothetical protein [uncultured Lactobacillus sp.]
MKVTFKKDKDTIEKGDLIFYKNYGEDWNVAFIMSRYGYSWYARSIYSRYLNPLDKTSTGYDRVHGGERSIDNLLDKFYRRWDFVKVASPKDLSIEVNKTKDKTCSTIMNPKVNKTKGKTRFITMNPNMKPNRND